MAEFEMEQSTSSSTVVVQDEEQDEQEVPVVRLTLRKPKTDKKVQWTTGTVDNENMNKKKSKCCCIYQKPRKLDESDSENDGDECDNCKGHVERRKQKRGEPEESPHHSPGGDHEHTPSTN